MISIPERRITFDPVKHKYTDNLRNPYTSVTTVIGSYTNKFDTKKMAEACARSGMMGNPKYAGKTASQLRYEWEQTTEVALEIGNKKHDYNDASIKEANGFFRTEASRTGRYITLYDVLTNPTFGDITLDTLIDNGFAITYPTVFEIISALVADGFKIYSEIGVYNPDWLVCGTIDVIAVKGNYAIILDWKTNKAPISFIAGYYEKDVTGKHTSKFIETNKFFKIPGLMLPDSVGNKYSMQVSLYGLLASYFGLTYLGGIICHITHDKYTALDINAGVSYTLLDKQVVNIINTPDLTNEARMMCEHFATENNKTRNSQLQLI